MSVQHTIKFEYINPTNIEEEVPHEQNLRTPELKQNTLEDDQNPPKTNEKPVEDVQVVTDHTFVPVMTVTKEEAVFTKGDLKLQKITVTEDISENKEDGAVYTVTNPVYSDIHSEVMLNQPIREAPEDNTDDETSNIKADNTEKDSTEEKKKTRIPKRRFKQTVEKIKQERRDSKENKEDEVPPHSPLRRSSIPRLRGSKIPPPHIKEDIKNTKEVKNYDKVPVAFTEIDKRIPIKHVTKDVKSEAKDVKLKPGTEPLSSIDKDVETKNDLKLYAVNIKDIKQDAKKLNPGENYNQDLPSKEITVKHEKIKVSNLEKPTSNNGHIISESKLLPPLTRIGSAKHNDEIKPKIIPNDEVKEACVENTKINIVTEVIKEVTNDRKLNENVDANEPVDEFDKIYEEIVTPTAVPSVDNVLVDRIEDPETLETTFEEIINDYEENKIHPLNLETVRPKISLVKQQSLHEGEVPKQIERRLSLKNIPFDDNENVKLGFKENKNKEQTNTNEIEKEKTVETEETSDFPETVSFVDNVFVDRIEDPETLETTFEEIINDYEENKIHSLNLETVRPKISLVKQQSLHEGEVPKQIERMLSLKNIPFDDNENVKIGFKENKNKGQTNTDEIEKEKTVETEETSDFPEKEVTVAPDTAHNEPIRIHEHTAVTPKESDDKRLKEHIKVATPVFDNLQYNSGLKDDIIETNNKEEIKPNEEVIATTSKKETESTLVNENLSAKVPDSTKMVQNILLRMDSSKKIKDSYENKTIDPDFDKQIKAIDSTFQDKDDDRIKKKEHVEKEREEEKTIPVPEEKVNIILSKIDSERQKPSEPAKKDIRNNTPKKQSIRSKIAIFTGSKDAESNQKVDIIKHSINNATIPKNLPNNSVRIDKQTKPSPVPSMIDKEKLTPSNKNEEASEDTKDKDHARNPTNKTGNIVHKNKNDSSTIIPVAVTDNNPNLKKQNFPFKIVEKDKTFSDKSNKVKETIDSESTKERESIENDITPALEEDKDINRDVPIPKGKVSRIISRIGSHDEKEMPKKELIPDIPKKKSVLSKVAMFERQTSNEPVKKPATLVIEKPKVIHEILKSQPLLRKPDQEPSVEITGNEAKYTNGKTQEAANTVKEENVKKSATEEFLEEPLSIAYSNDTNEYIAPTLKDNTISKENIDGSSMIRIALSDTEKEKEIINTDKTKFIYIETEAVIPDSGNQNEITQKDISENSKNIHIPSKEDEVFVNRTKEMPSIEVRLQRIKSRNEESNLKKTRSMAELDLGDAVKGKVHKMIYRINSMEKLDVDVEKKEIINIKERPRKKSVSEKIALFERKLIPVKMEDSTTNIPTITTATTTTQKPDPLKGLTTQPPMVDEEYNRRIEELNNAKINFGRMENMLYVELRNGMQMPVLALGTALLDPRLIRHVIKAAIDMGYRAIDSAYIYGNEKEVGEAIKEKIDDGTVTRQDLFIVSKLWSTFHRRDLVETACRASLTAMGLQYFDLYMIHIPMSFKEGDDPLPKIANVLQYSDYDYMDAWYGMEDLVSKGLVKSIGVSNFNSTQVARVNEKARVKPVVNQVECHPYLSQQRLDRACSDYDVKLSCFGVLGSKGTPPELKSNQLAVIDDPMVILMASGLGITPAQLLVRYQIELGHSVVVKSTNATHLWDNLQALTFNLTTTAINGLNALNKNRRAFTFSGMGDTHRNYPFKAAN